MTQDGPIQDGSDDATLSQKLAGIVVQVEADAKLGSAEDVDHILSQRLRDSGIELTAEQYADVRSRIGTGPGAA